MLEALSKSGCKRTKVWPASDMNNKIIWDGRKVTNWVTIGMVDGPAVGKAGDCLDWIAGGLEIKGLRDSGNPCPL